MSTAPGLFRSSLPTPLSALVCLACLMLCASVSAAAEHVLIVGDDSYPPYCFLNQGRNDGIYIHILERVFQEMPEYQVDVRLFPWKRALRMAQNGDAFGIVPPYFGPDERPYLHPYSDPILEEVTVAWCGRTKGVDQRTPFPDGYQGLTFGLNTGFDIVARPFQQAVEQNRIQVDPVPGTSRNIMRLLLGRVDCYINDRRAILWTLSRLRHDHRYAHLLDSVHETAVVSRHAGYIGYSTHWNTAHFAKRFNQELRRLKQSGEIQRIADCYLKQHGITGNDLAR